MKQHILMGATALLACTMMASSFPPATLPANELGRIMILEYHRLGDKPGDWYRSEAAFRNDLETLRAKGYRPITVAQLIKGDIDLPAGTTPVVFVFDDSSLGQFDYQDDGKTIEPHTFVAIWDQFRHAHPEWSGGATWCVLPGAEYPSNFWGEKPSKQIPRVERERRIKSKLDFMVSHGHEICNHTLWHATLSKYPDAFVQEQIARGADSIRHYLPDYKVVTFALPLGEWPKNRALAWHGCNKGSCYDYPAVLEVSGGPDLSPFSNHFDAHKLTRLIASGSALARQLAYYDAHPGERYVSDGDKGTVSYPAAREAELARRSGMKYAAVK